MKLYRKLLLAICVIFSTEISAQCVLGIKGGINYSTIGGDANRMKLRKSIHLGLFHQQKLNENITLQPELVYSSQGAKSSTGAVEYVNNYLNLPVMLKFRLIRGVSCEVGPQFGLLLSANERVYDITLSDNDPDDFDLAFSLGLGFENEIVLLETRANLGIISSNTNRGFFPNQVLQATIGFKIL